MRVSIMFRGEGAAPERAAHLTTALEGAGHRVSERSGGAGPTRVWRAVRDSPEVIHAVGFDAAPAAALAARMSRAALVCEALPGESDPSRRTSRAMRAAAVGRRGGTVLAWDEDQATQLRAALGLPYLPPLIGGTEPGIRNGDPMLLAVYDRLPHLNPELPIEAAGTGGRAGRWLAELAEPVRRGALRRPGALIAYVRGRRLRARGRFPRAVEALTRAAKRSDGDPVYELYAVKALRESGEGERALNRLEKLAATEDADPGLLGEVGVELTRFGSRERAREVARRLADGTGSESHAESWAEAARVYAALGDLDSARELARRAAAEAPDRSGAQRTAALALEQAGEPSQALDLARRTGAEDQERRLAGLLRELEPGWIPQLHGRREGVARDDRILALLEVSLPQAPSGYAYRSRDLLAALRDDGFEAEAATRIGFPASRGARNWSPVESVEGVVHHRLNVPGLLQYSGVPLDLRVQENARSLLDPVRRNPPAAIIAGTPDLNARVALALRSATGVPVVYDVRGFPEMSWAAQTGGSDSELYRLRRTAETACASAADTVITLSETMRDELSGRGVERDSIFVVPHVVDADRFAPRPRDPQLARSYGLAGKLVVGSVTSLTDYEGIDDLIRAVALAQPSWPELAALIVGDGRYRPALESLVAELGLGRSVVFTGRLDQDQVPDHYALLDLFAIPRRDLEVCRAVTPLKPFEALSMGIPMLASDLPALAEIVSASGGGRTFAPGSEQALAESILDLGADPAAREQLGRSGREYVLAHHTAERATDAIHAALGSIVGENGRRRQGTKPGGEDG
jgi:glycosyltransferase involved in cell wall biosynthesis/Flp pilus assembly protein TadD